MKKLGLTYKIFLAIGLGVICGLFINIALPSGTLKDDILLDGILKLFGTGFINAIKMLVVPLVFISLVCGSSSMGDVTKLGRIGIKTMLFYFTTTAIAISLSLLLANVINPGEGLDMSQIITTEPTIAERTSLVDTVLNMIPTNPIESLANGEMLQIIFFSLLIGISISLMGEKGAPIRNAFELLNELSLKMLSIIMNFAPIGVFGLITTTFSTVGLEAIFALSEYVFTVLLVLLIHAVIVYPLIGKTFTGLNLKPFFKKYANVAGVAFSTSTSNACIPIAIETMEDLGVDNSVASFTIPLGSTINMDGTAIMQGVSCIFIATLYGIDLNFETFMTIILTATLASVGTAGVPGVGMITLSMVLTSAGLPIEGIGLIMGVDRIIDMFRTVVNVMGDCMCTLVVSKLEGDLNTEKYHSHIEN